MHYNGSLLSYVLNSDSHKYDGLSLTLDIHSHPLIVYDVGSFMSIHCYAYDSLIHTIRRFNIVRK